MYLSINCNPTSQTLAWNIDPRRSSTVSTWMKYDSFHKGGSCCRPLYVFIYSSTTWLKKQHPNKPGAVLLCSDAPTLWSETWSLHICFSKAWFHFISMNCNKKGNRLDKLKSNIIYRNQHTTVRHDIKVTICLWCMSSAVSVLMGHLQVFDKILDICVWACKVCRVFMFTVWQGEPCEEEKMTIANTYK